MQVGMIGLGRMGGAAWCDHSSAIAAQVGCWIESDIARPYRSFIPWTGSDALMTTGVASPCR
jgi:hypothetical protein